MSEQQVERGGFRAFAIVWLGQVVSLFGSTLTSFALGVWVYQTTGSVTRFALIAFFTTLPATLLSPVLGSWVDRSDRRKAMILGDLLAGLCTVVAFFLIWGDALAIWHIYVLMAVAAAGNTTQVLAFTASTALLVPKRHLGRANGMTQSGGAAAEIAAPIFAGFLMTVVSLEWIILIDVVTFLFAVGALLAVRIPRPQPRKTADGDGKERSVGGQVGAAWTYLKQRPGLAGLMYMMALINFTRGLAIVLITPLVLGFASVKTLGTVLSTAGFGMLVGGVVMSVWGGPPKRVNGVYGALALYTAVLALAGVVTTEWAMVVVAFLIMFPAPIINGCSQAIWQIKVDLDLQGRIFAFRRMITFAMVPLAQLVAGPLTDRVLEPLLAADGALAGSVGRVTGVGPGRGIGFGFVLMSLLMLLTLAWIYLDQRVRRVEEDLPDVVREGPDEAAGEPGRAAENLAES